MVERCKIHVEGSDKGNLTILMVRIRYKVEYFGTKPRADKLS